MNKQIDFKKISNHEGPEKSPGFLLWHISTSWRSSLELILKPFDLTHPQFVVLAALGWLTKDGDRVTQVMIGKMACLDPNTTSQIIRGLEQKRFLRREQSSDGRAKNPLLTQTGRDAIIKALPAVELADQKFFASLTKQEMKDMLGVFQKLTKREGNHECKFNKS